VRRYPGGHFDIYIEPLRSRVIADQIAFLQAHVAQAQDRQPGSMRSGAVARAPRTQSK
jgi:hypothetical protein